MRPKFNTPSGSKLCFKPRLSLKPKADGGSNTSTAARSESGARISVAWPLADATARRTADAAVSLACGRDPDEAAAPVKEMGERGFVEADGERRRPRGSETYPPDRAIAAARR